MYRFGSEEIEAAVAVLRSRRLFRYLDEDNGYAVRFERALAGKLRMRHGLLVSSGTAALVCALKGVGVGPGDEVLLPGYTFIATALAVRNLGAEPVLCEVDETLTMDPHDAATKITERTKAVLPVHMNGLPCRMDRLTALAADAGLSLVEDACQALGGTFNGRFLGTFGRAGVFSFNQHKILTAGEGGAVVTDDASVFERAFIQHDGSCATTNLSKRFKTSLFAGFSYRASEITGAILLAQLEKLNGILRDLRTVKKSLCTVLEELPGLILAPCHDPAGECGTSLALQFETPKAMQRFCQVAEGGPLSLYPAGENLHLFIGWNGVVDPARRPCPRTKDLVERTAIVDIDPDLDMEGLERFQKTVKAG